MDRQWNYATGLPDPRYPGRGRGLNAHNGAGIWVNEQGRRFVNETASTKERFRALLRQEPARLRLLFDSKGVRRLFVSGSDWADFETVDRLILQNAELTTRADSIEQLALATGLPPAELVSTVERYNEMLAEGVDHEFRRFGFGGVPYDLAPFAEEGPIPFDAPPFYALTLYPLARKSMGGVRIDLSTRALDRAGSPIPGLYAVGELAGFGGVNGWAGLEGTFLGPPSSPDGSRAAPSRRSSGSSRRLEPPRALGRRRRAAPVSTTQPAPAATTFPGSSPRLAKATGTSTRSIAWSTPAASSAATATPRCTRSTLARTNGTKRA